MLYNTVILKSGCLFGGSNVNNAQISLTIYNSYVNSKDRFNGVCYTYL